MVKIESELKEVISRKNGKKYYMINTYYYVGEAKVKVNTYFLNYKEITILGLNKETNEKK